MRITTRLRIVSTLAAIAAVVLLPVLFWSFSEFSYAKNNFLLADAIQDNFFERASFRDQYFLYREDRARIQWDNSKEIADALLQQAKAEFHSENNQLILERLLRNNEDSATIFHRIVQTTESLKSDAISRGIYEQLDKRLSSQLLLQAVAAHDMATAMLDAGRKDVEAAYNRLVYLLGLIVVVLTLAVVLTLTRLEQLIRQRLLPLHDGAGIVAAGHLDYRIPSDGTDEFAELACSINAMADKLTASRKQLKDILENAADAIFITDQQGRYQYVNSQASLLLGYSREELLNMQISDITPSEDLPKVLNLFEAFLATGSLRSEFKLKGRDGGTIPVEVNGTILPDGNVFGAYRDITERKRAEEKLQLAASVFAHAREGIMITDLHGTIVEVNDAFSRITGYGSDEVVGQNPRILSSGLQEKSYYSEMWRTLLSKGHWYGEVWNRRKSGEVYAEMQTISTVYDPQGKAKNFVALFSDITTIKKQQSQLEHLAHYDALTRLPNRLLFADRLQQAMAQAERRAQPLAVVFLDLDGFKAINDNHGHEAGDQLLITVASRMKEAIREGDTLARFGGDEFVAILADLPDLASSETTLLRLLAAAAQPVYLGDLVLQVSASIGVTFYPQAGPVDDQALLRQADAAMYQAKESGRNRYCIFDAG